MFTSLAKRQDEMKARVRSPRPMSDLAKSYRQTVSEMPEPFKGLPWRFRGWGRTLRSAIGYKAYTPQMHAKGTVDYFCGLTYEQARKEWNEIHELPNLIPDAHCIHNGWLYCLEIVDTNDISEQKAVEYDKCWSLFGAGDIDLMVVLYYPRLKATLYIDDFYPLFMREYGYGSIRKAFDSLRKRWDDPCLNSSKTS